MKRLINLCVLLTVLLVALTAVPAQAKAMKGFNNASWSPDGKSILLGYNDLTENDWNLYLMDATSHKTTLLAEDAFGATWSPDGTQIAYIDAQAGLTLVAVNDSAEQQLIKTTGQIYSPSWSPDGSMIAFYSNYNTEFKSGSNLLSVVSTSGGEPQVVYEGDGGFVWSATWSPDSQNLTFTEFHERSNELVVMIGQPDGSTFQPVETTISTDGTVNWSPDGSRIVMVTDCEGKVGICTMNPDGTDRLWLADGQTPTWSPDGAHVAYVSNSQICAVNTDGSNASCLTKPPAESNDYEPVWSPDGSQLLFLRMSVTNPETYELMTQAFVMQADGSGLTELLLPDPLG